MSLVFGMIRKDKFNFVDMYREEAFTAIRACVKQVHIHNPFTIYVIVTADILMLAI